MRKEKYLKSLRKYLESKKIKNLDKIIEKYDNLITEKMNEGSSMKEAIHSLKSFDEIYKEENKSVVNSTLLKLKEKIRNIKSIKDIKIKAIDLSKINFYNILLYLIIVVFSLTFILNSVIFFSSLFLILDGAKIYGIGLFLLSLIAFNVIILIFINKKINKTQIELKKYLKIILVNSIVFLFSISLLLFQFYKLDNVSDVSEKYEMKTVIKDIALSGDTNKKYYIYFNSWYDNKYIVHYDNSLSNKIEIKMEYYECFYNSIIKLKGSSAYLSLVKNKRDLLSFYIDNLRENKVYDAKELSRNVINIYVSEEDYKRLVLVD